MLDIGLSPVNERYQTFASIVKKSPLLLGPAISILVFLLVLMNMVPIQLIFWHFLYPFWLRVLPNVIFVIYKSYNIFF